jgi:hypothetical protein
MTFDGQNAEEQQLEADVSDEDCEACEIQCFRESKSGGTRWLADSAVSRSTIVTLQWEATREYA